MPNCLGMMVTAYKVLSCVRHEKVRGRSASMLCRVGDQHLGTLCSLACNWVVFFENSWGEIGYVGVLEGDC